MKQIKTESTQFRTEPLIKKKLELVAKVMMRSRSGMLRVLIEEAYKKLPGHIKAEFERDLNNG